MRDQFSFDTLAYTELYHFPTGRFTRYVHPNSPGREALTFDNLADEVSESVEFFMLFLQCNRMPLHREQTYHYHADSTALSCLGKIRL